MRRRLAAAVLPAFMVAPGSAQSPGEAQWIWGSWADSQPRPNGERCYFRHRLELDGEPAEFVAHVTSDNHFVLHVNGKVAGRGDDWGQAQRLPLSAFLRRGVNLIAVECWNDSAQAALLFFAEGRCGGRKVSVESDSSWLTSASAADGWTTSAFDDASWKLARAHGPLGSSPWGNVPFARDQRFETLPGFSVSKVAEGLGSIIALAAGRNGHLFVSIEGGGLLELADADADGAMESVVEWTKAVRAVQGMCLVEDDLIVTGVGPEGLGLYRVGADAAHSTTLLCAFDGDSGEHGPHAVELGPDGKLYVMLGNHAFLKKPWNLKAPYRDFYEGHLLPRYVDPGGHAVKIKAPGGVLFRISTRGGTPEAFVGGFRNAYDFAFTRGGELLTYDSDMEWDLGLPWYRQTRIYHLIEGGEYGWRTGSMVWPPWYEDALPPVLDVGRGSPTGVAMYYGEQFPRRFFGSLLICDWSQGRILAVFFEPRGVTYQGSAELLLSGKPLNVTDLVVENNGSVLFATGGRGTRGAVYRLSHEGPADSSPLPDLVRPAPMPSLQGEAQILAAINSEDRFVRFAAARALEEFPEPRLWELALNAADGRSRSSILLTMAQSGLRSTQTRDDVSRRIDLLRRLVRDEPKGPARWTALRALELVLLDKDARDVALAELALDLLAQFPAAERESNRELAILIAHLKPEGAVEPLLRQLEAETSRAEQIHFAYALRCLPSGWTPDVEERFARFLKTAARWPGGFSFAGYIAYIRKDFEALLPEARRTGLFPPEEKTIAATPSPLQATVPRVFDRVLSYLIVANTSDLCSPEEGRVVFERQCVRCHRRGEMGGGVGPDLSTLFSRFTLEEILESMFEPSRQISDQYQTITVATTDGELWSGMPLVDDGQKLCLLQSTGEILELPAFKVARRRKSDVSTMPAGLLDALTMVEIADLHAYLDSDLLALPTPSPAHGPSPAAGSPSEGLDHDPPGELVPLSRWARLFENAPSPGSAANAPAAPLPLLCPPGVKGDLGHFVLDGGVLSGDTDGQGKDRVLIVDGVPPDFCLEAEVCLEKGSAGILFRAASAADAPSAVNGGTSGYEVRLSSSEWGSLFAHDGRGKLFHVENDVWRHVVELDGWNHVMIRAEGDRLRVELSGVTAVDLRDDEFSNGGIGFVLSGGQGTRLRLRNLRLRPLSATELR